MVDREGACMTRELGDWCHNQGCWKLLDWMFAELRCICQKTAAFRNKPVP